jgi:hypothetical protein
MAQQTQNDSDAVRLASDPTKMSAFDLIERNIMRDVESDRKAQFQALESAGNQNTFGGLVGRIGLETFDKYGNTLTRVASYVNQAHQMAIDHHNFLVRREELNESGATEMVFTARDINDLTASTVGGSSVTATFTLANPCVVTLSQSVANFSPVRFAVSTGGTFASPLKAATTYFLREISEGDRTYNIYLTAAAAAAATTGTAVSTSGSTQTGTFTISGLSDRDVQFDPRVPAEVIRLLSLGLMMMDAGVPVSEAGAMKQQAVALIERNVTTAVEKARRERFQTLATGPAGANNQNTFGGLAGRIGLETVARYRISEVRIKSYINQAYQAAIDHHNFVARRETYDRAALTFAPLAQDADAFNAVIPAEVVRLIVLSYIANDQAAAPMAGPLTALSEAQQR